MKRFLQCISAAMVTLLLGFILFVGTASAQSLPTVQSSSLSSGQQVNVSMSYQLALQTAARQAGVFNP
ncbi:MAG TPA: hypothetical protein VH593_34160, partial [Ktedonobacteraceae bacterium]